MADEIVLRYSLKVQKVHFILEDENGKEGRFHVREMSGEGRDTFMTKLTEKVQFGPDGKPTGVRSVSGLELALLELSVCDEAGGLVPLSTIKTWPASVTTALHKHAQKLNGLDLDSGAEKGNASGVSAINGSSSPQS